MHPQRCKWVTCWYMGPSFLKRGPLRWVVFLWFPFKTDQKGYPQRKADPYITYSRIVSVGMTIGRVWPSKSLPILRQSRSGHVRSGPAKGGTIRWTWQATPNDSPFPYVVGNQGNHPVKQPKAKDEGLLSGLAWAQLGHIQIDC